MSLMKKSHFSGNYLPTLPTLLRIIVGAVRCNYLAQLVGQIRLVFGPNPGQHLAFDMGNTPLEV